MARMVVYKGYLCIKCRESWSLEKDAVDYLEGRLGRFWCSPVEGDDQEDECGRLAHKQQIWLLDVSELESASRS